MKDIEKAVNAWYREWLKTHDPFDDDFSDDLYRVIPNVTFTYDTHSDYWILI